MRHTGRLSKARRKKRTQTPVLRPFSTFRPLTRSPRARRVRPKAAACPCGTRQAPVCWSHWKRRQQRHARCVFRAHHVYRSKDGRRNHPAFPRKRLFILRSRLLFMGFTGLGGHVRKRRARPRFEVHTARSIRRPWISERGSCSSKKNSSIDTFILRVYFLSDSTAES